MILFFLIIITLLLFRNSGVCVLLVFTKIVHNIQQASNGLLVSKGCFGIFCCLGSNNPLTVVLVTTNRADAKISS